MPDSTLVVDFFLQNSYSIQSTTSITPKGDVHYWKIIVPRVCLIISFCSFIKHEMSKTAKRFVKSHSLGIDHDQHFI